MPDDSASIPNAAAERASPFLAQYFEAKRAQPDALVFFRMGDFYELFFEDAVKAAEAVGITLTQRGQHGGEPIPMAGVPAHTAEAYLAKLIRSGFKVAVCEQMESPAEAKKRGSKSIVRRDITRVVTPGTLTEDSLLDSLGANRLAAVAARGGQTAIASLELSTGEVECLLVAPDRVAGALAALSPSEVLAPERLFAEPAIGQALRVSPGLVQPMANALAEPSASEARLKRLYGVASLDGFGALAGAEIAALGLIAAHLETTQAGKIPALRAPRRAGESDILAIDPATRASLEIDRSLAGSREGSLLAAIDRTVTAPGARLLAARLARPSSVAAVIEGRLDAIAWFLERQDARADLRAALKGAPDMARALSRLVLGRGGPRDLAALRDGLIAGARAAERLAAEALPPPDEIVSALAALRIGDHPNLAALAAALERGLSSELPTFARDGGFVAAGVSVSLDEARALRDDSRRVIVALESRLAAETGVALRIRHNAVLGYYIETTAKQAEPLMTAPLNAQFIHRQTMANQVRFTTVELADLDAKIARAGDQALALEMEIFGQWVEAARAASAAILAAAEALARLDVAAAQAQWAAEENACRPVIEPSLAFDARAARHPVVEASVRRNGEVFTANDCLLSGSGLDGPRLALVTGPNMAGKSTFLRQNALLVIMAQAGCYVPAASFRLGLVDRLFSRVGAGDDLARGRSTFMAEMIETAAILTQATARSFVILDEIGRGTATWDGLAIAWAAAEALHETNRCRALFATHYHELADLEGRLAYVANLSLRAKEFNGDLVFLHEAAPGRADRSYGVQVAKLAGVPAPVVARARQVLDRLEREAPGRTDLGDLPLFAAVAEAAPAFSGPSPVDEALSVMDLDGMSPREAMDALYRLKEMLR